LTSNDPEVLPPLEAEDAAGTPGDAKSDQDPSEGAVLDIGPDELTVAEDLATPDADDDVIDVTTAALADGSPIVADPATAGEDGPSIFPVIPAYDDSATLPSAPGQVSALTAYMSQLRHHAPITREEEHELAVQWREEGDISAARQLVLSNLRLVVKISMEYRRAWTNTLDLIQEGNVGLMEAVQRYDPYQGVKLSSYAVYWIRAYILKYILDNMRTVRLGTTRASRKLFFRLNKEKARLEREGFEVEPKLIADRLDVSEDDVLEMENRLSRPDTYLDAPARRDESGGATIGDGFATPGSSAEAQVGDRELQSIFMEKMEAYAADLGERDQRILRERILAEEPRTLADMGEEFGVSRERVRQLEARLVNNLRKYMQENLVDFEYYAPPKDA
jgi:RNA polymerase sigma-32 factor